MEVLSFGDGVGLVRLEGAPNSYVELIDYGAALRGVVVPDRDGNPVDVCLGYDTLEEYRARDGLLGAITGRCANRVGGASFELGGRIWPLAANVPPNHLHGGFAGFDKKVWSRRFLGDGVRYSLRSPDGDEGYPGNLDVTVTYRFAGGLLSIDYEARCDADTVVNLTNHAYWNLSGHGAGAIGSHELLLPGDRFTEMGEGFLPTGRVLPVAGTPLDFTAPTPVGSRLNDPYLLPSGGYDHNYVLPEPDAAGMRPAGRLRSPDTGIALTVSTTLPGTQLYTANSLSPRRGKGGVGYAPHNALCLETQCFPDAIHHPHFPSPVLRPGEVWRHRSEYKFEIL